MWNERNVEARVVARGHSKPNQFDDERDLLHAAGHTVCLVYRLVLR
jgi:hypothetical protein